MRLPGVKLRKPPKIGEEKPATIRLQDPGSGFETFFAPWEAFLRRMESNWQDREEFLFVKGDFWGSFSEDRWTLVKQGKRWKIIFAENYRPGKYE